MCIRTHTDEELADFLSAVDDGSPAKLRIDFFKFSNKLKSKMANQIQFLLPTWIHWLSGPILSSVFDKKLLNLDSEHLQGVSEFYCFCDFDVL